MKCLMTPLRLSVSEVDAKGKVFRDAAETPKLEGTTLPLPIHGQKEAENYVCEDTLEILSGFELDAEGEVLGDTAETPELEVTTLPLPIQSPLHRERSKTKCLRGPLRI